MHWLYTVFLLFILFAGLAMMVREGLWSNLLTLFNVLFSGILAFSMYGALATWLDERLDGEYTYLLDYLSLWVVFSICMLVLRLCTDSLSRTRVRFKKPIESVGGPLVGLIAAWVVVGIVGSIFHTAPLAKGFLGNAIVVEQEADVEMSPFRPHLHWLRFAGSAVMKFGSADVVDKLKGNTDGLEKTASMAGYSEFTRDKFISWSALWARIYVVKYQLRREQFEENATGMRVDRS